MISHLDNWLFPTVRNPHCTTNPLLHLATLRLCGKRIDEAVQTLFERPIPGYQYELDLL